MELHYLTECSSPRLRIYFLTSPKQLPEGLFHRCLPFIGYPAAEEFRGAPEASVQRSGEVRLSVLHATASTSTAAITAPVADWANCLVIAVRLPVQFSYFVHVGENLSYTHSPDDSLAGVLLPHLPQVLSEGRCLMIEGRAALRGSGVLYRGALYPLSDDGSTIDHVLGAANCRPLCENEELISPHIRTKWL